MSSELEETENIEIIVSIESKFKKTRRDKNE